MEGLTGYDYLLILYHYKFYSLNIYYNDWPPKTVNVTQYRYFFQIAYEMPPRSLKVKTNHSGFRYFTGFIRDEVSVVIVGTDSYGSFCWLSKDEGKVICCISIGTYFLT